VWRSHQLATACKMARQIRFAVLPAELRCSVSQARSRSTKAYIGRFGGDDSQPVDHGRGFAEPAADIVHLCSWPSRQGVSGLLSRRLQAEPVKCRSVNTSMDIVVDAEDPFCSQVRLGSAVRSSAKFSSSADGRCGSRGRLTCPSSRKW
jgi:hypothetical protein